MALFPLTVASSQPAFPADQSEVKIYFAYPNTKDLSIRTQVQYAISYQKTNKTALINNKAVSASQDPKMDEKGRYIIIPSSEIKNGWEPGAIYKVQLRTYQQGEWSEWSTICYIKATGMSTNVQVEILNDLNGNISYVNSPVFKGRYSNPTDLSETETRYKFDLCDLMENVIESTGWKTHNQSNFTDSVVFNTELQNYTEYKVIYTVETKNGYIKSDIYQFNCLLNILKSPVIDTFVAKNVYEEGAIELTIQNFIDGKSDTAPNVTGNFILRRTDSRSNFQKWEDYRYFQIADDIIDIHFNDYLVESGVEYRYGIQLIHEEGYRGVLYYSNTAYCAYEHMFLVGDNRQLKIKYNPQISSYKRQLQETKTETIGSKYPFILRNGEVNYFSFPINGLITYHLDEQEAFCKRESLIVCDPTRVIYNDEKQRDICVNKKTKAVSSDKIIDNIKARFTMPNLYDVNLTDDNVITEREFRNQVEEFLTNGNYKFFKSPTEGIKIVAITGVSLTPNQTLSRMIHSFSSTAQEVKECTLPNALDYGIISRGSYIDVRDMGYTDVSGNFQAFTLSQDEDLFDKIQRSLAATSTDGIVKKLKYLSYIKIEILNPMAVNDKGYIIQIKQSENGPYEKIRISKEVPVYELSVVNLYGLKASTAGINITLTYEGVTELNSTLKAISPTAYKGISKFYQLYNQFSQALANQDIIKTILEQEQGNGTNLYFIANLSFLRIDAKQGTQIKVNGEEITIGNSNSYELRNVPITSAVFITDTMASVTVVYNGVLYA